jgi:hypothetical protein
MLIPAPTEAMPTRKASLLVCVAKAGREDGRECRDGGVHQSREAGLDNLEDEPATLGLAFLVAYAGGLLLLIQLSGKFVVLALLSGEVPEQLTHRGVARLRDGGTLFCLRESTETNTTGRKLSLVFSRKACFRLNSQRRNPWIGSHLLP